LPATHLKISPHNLVKGKNNFSQLKNKPNFMLLGHKNADNNKLMKNYFAIFKVNFTVEL